jgi:hypothetical protein
MELRQRSITHGARAAQAALQVIGAAPTREYKLRNTTGRPAVVVPSQRLSRVPRPRKLLSSSSRWSERRPVHARRVHRSPLSSHHHTAVLLLGFALLVPAWRPRSA